jgi:NH3-dependent NAD+ synthetase
MNKTYHYEIPQPEGGVCSPEFDTIEDCVEDCKRVCQELGVDYNDRAVKLFLTNDYGETYEECTEEGELAG